MATEPAAALQSCYRHPDRQTGVRCQRCERPICAQCMVPAAVGFQCPDCVKASRSRSLPARYLLQGATPYLTYGLIALNALAFFAGPLLGVDAIRAGGLFGPAVAAGQWWRIVTSGFLHVSITHIAFNMLALFMFGPPLERSLGRWRYLLVYFTSLLAGSLGALAASPHALTVGASGAIFGLFGAVLAGQRASGVGVRAGGLLPFLVINLLFTFASPGVSIGGHLGGLAGGFLAGAILFAARRRRDPSSAWAAAAACAGLLVALFAAGLWVAAHPLIR